MSFRCRQKFITSPCSSVFSLEETTLETGEIEHNSFDLCKKRLPDPSLFDLEDNIKAGVNLEEVNSVLLQSESVTLSDVVGKKLDIKEREVKTGKTNNNEVNDEN